MKKKPQSGPSAHMIDLNPDDTVLPASSTEYTEVAMLNPFGLTNLLQREHTVNYGDVCAPPGSFVLHEDFCNDKCRGHGGDTAASVMSGAPFFKHRRPENATAPEDLFFSDLDDGELATLFPEDVHLTEFPLRQKDEPKPKPVFTVPVLTPVAHALVKAH